jgi:hypothetical protein
MRITGTWPAGRVDKIIADMFSIWEKYEKPLLIDLRDLEDTPSIFRDYEEAKQFARVGFWRAGRIAVLDTPKRRKANDFLETAANNRGVRFVFFYSDEEEAIARLLSEEEG